MDAALQFRLLRAVTTSVETMCVVPGVEGIWKVVVFRPVYSTCNSICTRVYKSMKGLIFRRAVFPFSYGAVPTPASTEMTRV